MFLFIGGVIVLATMYCLVRKYEPRMVLFVSGLTMAIISGDPMATFQSFSNSMHEYKLFEPIVAVMGFTVVMRVTECDQHLIHLLVNGLKRVGPALIPGATIVTFFINVSLTSAAGASAAAGSILIPLLMAAGVHPAMAAAAVFSGTFGSLLNPGFVHNVFVAEMAKTTPLNVIANDMVAIFVALGIIILNLVIVAYIRKENRGYEPPDSMAVTQGAEFKVSALKASIPVIPITILILGGTGVVPLFKPLSISHTMIIGTIIAFLVVRKSPGDVSSAFFKGMGDAFGNIFGIIICATIFVSGMNSLGMVKALTDAMISNPGFAKISSVFGPFIMAVMAGTGEAATLAFNKAVSVEAAKFGLHITDMGSAATIGGALGRTVSPITPGIIICSRFAGGVSPFEIIKRNGLGVLLAAIASLFLMLYK
ncbi:MAG: C4-dicarboxylate transporter DcuC [Veillonellales bacterium]